MRAAQKIAGVPDTMKSVVSVVSGRMVTELRLSPWRYGWRRLCSRRPAYLTILARRNLELGNVPGLGKYIVKSLGASRQGHVRVVGT